MSEERFKAWLTFWQFVLGTVVVGIFSTVISHQIQTREVEIKEQESNAKLLEQALQEDVGVRRRLSQYFANVTRSAELRTRWGEYARLVEAEYQETLSEKQRLQQEVKSPSLDAMVRDELQRRIAELERQLSPKPATIVTPLQARVYMHIGSDGQRSAAEQTASALRADSISVPGIELRPNSPQRTELRYFRIAERAEAEGLTATVRGVWPDAAAKYVPGYEASTAIRPRHYELWISASSAPRVNMKP
ncbi:hypothetical protein HA520_11325 [Azotobacter chroococcum]|uniref:Uncharacterized protein n=1 Tax=Azotobacter chroococcum TaxID=353 RepID=A0AA43Z715_9GAMM|nr:hypothetical protein [Azotobacter chroococcum]NHN77865.1 hypothetical protein [Azotobacter chroococcum]